MIQPGDGPYTREREIQLLTNMHRWRRVAEIEHAKHCSSRHDCGRAIETVYHELREADND